MGRDSVLRNFPDVSGYFILAKIGPVRPLAVLVPLASENANTAGGLEAEPHPADAGENIHEGKPTLRTVAGGRRGSIQ